MNFLNLSWDLHIVSAFQSADYFSGFCFSDSTKSKQQLLHFVVYFVTCDTPFPSTNFFRRPYRIFKSQVLYIILQSSSTKFLALWDQEKNNYSIFCEKNSRFSKIGPRLYFELYGRRWQEPFPACWVVREMVHDFFLVNTMVKEPCDLPTDSKLAKFIFIPVIIRVQLFHSYSLPNLELLSILPSKVGII